MLEKKARAKVYHNSRNIPAYSFPSGQWSSSTEVIQLDLVRSFFFIFLMATVGESLNLIAKLCRKNFYLNVEFYGFGSIIMSFVLFLSSTLMFHMEHL